MKELKLPTPPPPPGMMRTCTRCGEAKLVTEFYKDSRLAGGRARACKACSIASATEWYRANRGDANARRKHRYQVQRLQERELELLSQLEAVRAALFELGVEPYEH